MIRYDKIHGFLLVFDIHEFLYTVQFILEYVNLTDTVTEFIYLT